jgi:hypothetical protein
MNDEMTDKPMTVNITPKLMLTVGDVIKKLQEFDPNLPVFRYDFKTYCSLEIKNVFLEPASEVQDIGEHVRLSFCEGPNER